MADSFRWFYFHYVRPFKFRQLRWEYLLRCRLVYFEEITKELFEKYINKNILKKVLIFSAECGNITERP